jgi:hypothetical protein
MALRDRAEPVLLSLSGAVHLAAAQGIRAEYLPSPSRGWLSPAPWNAYLAERVVALAAETGARAVVFDGVHPYRGLIRARRQLPDVVFVWSRRGMWTAGRGRQALKAARDFDVIVEPGDLGAEADRGLTIDLRDAMAIPPVSLGEVIEPLDRAAARTALGLHPDAPTTLVSLSAGAGDPGQLLASAVRAVLERSAWHVAIVVNPLRANPGLPLEDPRVRPLVDVYPLVRYLRAFDAAIASAGYNASHELPLAGLPTLLVANTKSAWDDQLSRARGIAERGLALWARDDEPTEVGKHLRELLEDETLTRLKAALDGVAERERGGARAFAEIVIQAARGAGPRAEILRTPGRLRRDRIRWTVAALWEAVGFRPTLHWLVHNVRLLGMKLLRRPLPFVPPPLFSYVIEPRNIRRDAPAPNGDRPDVVLLTPRLTRAVIAGQGPIEHVLQPSSDQYRNRRLAIARRFYLPAESDPQGHPTT